MNKVKWLIASLLFAASGVSFAENFTLWINGRDDSGRNARRVGNYSDFGYWGSADRPAGVNKRAVNWNGTSRIVNQNAVIRDALDCYCTGNNWCYVSAHSAGNLQIGYALALHGDTQRVKRNPSVSSGGQCNAVDGSTQTGWNIRWVSIAGGAAGGSELANVGSWTQWDPLANELKTGTARGMYDHNQTRGVRFRMFAGARNNWVPFLPGYHDGVVAYHSTGGVANSTRGYGNRRIGGLLHELTMGSSKNSDGSSKWANHEVAFRDNNTRIWHSTEGDWRGIVHRAREDMVVHGR
jgi:hypothetical protein